MGNSQNWVTADTAFPTEQQLLNCLIPIEDAQNENQMLALGRFKIYRFRAEPYEIVMKHVRTFTPNNPKFRQYEEAAKTVGARLDHKNIAKIHSVQICRRSNICMEQISIESYVNYYGINLQGVIDQHKNSDRRLPAEQLWYILNSLVEVSLYLQAMDIHFGIYLPKNINLSSQGYLKLYLHHCTPANQHFLYHHLIGNDSRDMHKYLPLPPECLPLLKKRAMSIEGLNLQKLDVFGIGMVALEAMLFNPTRRYYLTDSGESEVSLNFDVQQLKKDFKELREVYPLNLVSLVQSMVKTNPLDRISLSGASTYIKSVRQHISISGALRMLDEDTPPQNKLSYKFTSRNCQQVLKNITSSDNKLSFFPLKTIRPEQQSRYMNQFRSLGQSQNKHPKLQIANHNQLKLSKPHKLQLSSVSMRLKASGREWRGESRLLSSFR